MHRSFALRFALATLVLLAGQGPAALADDRFDEAVRTLRKATTIRATGEHILLLSSLRQLHDPDLEPLFSSLSQIKNPTIQINAVLGLAELSRHRRIDSWKLSQIKDTRFRALAIIQARDDELISATELREVLIWPDLTEDLRVYVLLMLVGMGESVESESLTTLMTKGELPGTRAYAALALCHLGQSEGTEEPLKALETLPPLVRDGAVREMLGTVAYMKLRGAAPWIESLLKAGDLSPTAEGIALRSLLALDSTAGAALWREQYRNADNVGHQVRLALMLLEQASSVPPEMFDVITNANTPATPEDGGDPLASSLQPQTNELLSRIAAVGRIVASGQDAVSACVELIDRRFPPLSAWVLEYAATLESGPASTLYSALIADTLEEGTSLNDRLELARLASAELLELDVAQLRSALDMARSRQRRLAVEAILSGALTAANPQALKLIEGMNDWVSTRAQSLALLIRARYAESITDEDLNRLSLVSRGGGSVTPAGEIQAAWLYLRRTGQQGQALAAILSDLSLGNGDR